MGENLGQLLYQRIMQLFLDEMMTVQNNSQLTANVLLIAVWLDTSVYM